MNTYQQAQNFCNGNSNPVCINSDISFLSPISELKITNKRVNNNYISQSNCATSVFIELLCVAGKDIAVETYQKELVQWFTAHYGKGWGIETSGFDVSEICWQNNIFDTQKQFILTLINRAINKQYWSTLDYEPHENIIEALYSFKQMVSDYNID